LTTISLDPADPPGQAIAKAVAAIRAGGLVVYPTRCLYGLGVDALDGAAVQRLFRAKRRAPDKPVSVLVKDMAALDLLVTGVPEAARVLIERFWPGGLTLVLPARPEVPAELTAGTGTIGVRLPGHPVAAALVAAMEGPITATSANLSGDKSPVQIADIAPGVIAAAAVVLDAGLLSGGAGSTVVDATAAPVRVLREGILPAAEVMAALAGLRQDRH